MRAVIARSYGGPEVLAVEEVPTPKAGAGQAVVAVKACGVNFPDTLIIAGKYQFKPEPPFSPGGEVAGVVTEVGEGVTAVKVGDRVIALMPWGGYAEAVVADATRLVPIPEGVDFVQAASLLTTYGTTIHAFVDRAQLKKGESVLVLGAAGGVGLAAVQLGKLMGARVIAAASTEEKVQLCKQHGADGGVVYGRGPFDRDGQRALTQLFKDATGPDGANVIYDAIGDAYAEPALRSIAWEGRYLVVGFAAGEIPKIPLNLALLKGCEIVGVFWGDWVRRNPEHHRRNVAELMALYEAGKIRPYVSERFPLAQGAQAIARLANRQVLGKVVVTMD